MKEHLCSLLSLPLPVQARRRQNDRTGALKGGRQTSYILNPEIEKSLRERAQASGRSIAMEIHLNLSLSLGLLDYEQERLDRPVDSLEGHHRTEELRSTFKMPE